MLDISIIVGLFAMFSWGIADFMQSVVIRRVGEYKSIVIGNALGFLTLIPFLFNENSFKILWSNLIILLLAGITQVIAIVNFYKSMKIGEIAIVTPISASYPIVTVSLMLLLGSKLSFLSIIAIFILIIGIILTSIDIRKIKNLYKTKGVKESLVALLLWGVYFFVMNICGNDVDFLGINFPKTHYRAMFFYTTVINGLFMIAYALYKKGMPNKKDLTKNTILFFIITTIIYSVAWLVVTYGITVGNTAIITPISSIYPMITAVLAIIFYKEKLVFNQKIGIFTILLGLILISL